MVGVKSLCQFDDEKPMLDMDVFPCAPSLRPFKVYLGLLLLYPNFNIRKRLSMNQEFKSSLLSHLSGCMVFMFIRSQR